VEWYLKALKSYAVFEGRSRRKEYWMFILINMIISLVLALLSFGTLESLYALAVFIPSLSVSVRRLHDTNRSGWWLLIGLVPFIGALVLIYFFIQDSHPGLNQYGPNPKEESGYYSGSSGEGDSDDDVEVVVLEPLPDSDRKE
jgi:uncharacterized membrane protein YhaH (DUF805 family)